MNGDRIILGIYINPWVWVVENDEEYKMLNGTDFDIRNIIFNDKLTNEVEICIQRQGFLVASFSNNFFDVDLGAQKRLMFYYLKLGTV